VTWFVGKKMPVASETFPNTYYFSMEVGHYILIFGSAPEFTYPPTNKKTGYSNSGKQDLCGQNALEKRKQESD